MQKNLDYRKIHKQYRDEMEHLEVEELSAKICSYLEEANWYQKAELIFSYYPLGNEVSTRKIHQKIWEDGKILALPRVSGNSIEFYQVQKEEELESGTFHIMEPKQSCRKVNPTESEYPIVFVPGLVFDEKGNRYGYGKGYYDRFFAENPSLKHRYALAYEHQMEKELPVKKTDVPMTRIYTEIGCRKFEGE